MHRTSTRSARGPTRVRANHRRRRGILALLAALGCLAGLAATALMASPSRPSRQATSHPGAVTPRTRTVTPRARRAAPHRHRLAAVAWPAEGVSAADISGFGVAAGPGAT